MCYSEVRALPKLHTLDLFGVPVGGITLAGFPALENLQSVQAGVSRDGSDRAANTFMMVPDLTTGTARLVRSVWNTCIATRPPSARLAMSASSFKSMPCSPPSSAGPKHHFSSQTRHRRPLLLGPHYPKLKKPRNAPTLTQCSALRVVHNILFSTKGTCGHSPQVPCLQLFSFKSEKLGN